MPLKIISWNCLNLSPFLSLGDATMTIGEKCVYIAEFINRFQPEVTILLEAGVDGANIANYIVTSLNGLQPPGGRTQQNSFVYYVSPPVYSGDPPGIPHAKTRIETYIAIVKKNTVILREQIMLSVNNNQILQQGIVFRDAWLLGLTYNMTLFYIAAIHAPSPGHNIGLRTAIVQNALASLAALPVFNSFNPIIFLGDFNFQLNEFANLQGIMNPHFTWAGPANVAGVPASTSLKTPTNQIKLDQPTNQPYDQFWMLRPPANFETSAFINIGMGQDDRGLLHVINNQINILGSAGNVLAKWASSNALSGNNVRNIYDNTLNTVNGLNAFLDNNKKTINSLPPLDPVPLSNLQKNIPIIVANLPRLIGTAGVPDDIAERSILTRVGNAALIVNSYLTLKMERGSSGVDQLNQAIYRIAFSDHIPIQLIIS